jgi:hypothetical protein
VLVLRWCGVRTRGDWVGVGVRSLGVRHADSRACHALLNRATAVEVVAATSVGLDHSSTTTRATATRSTAATATRSSSSAGTQGHRLSTTRPSLVAATRDRGRAGPRSTSSSNMVPGVAHRLARHSSACRFVCARGVVLPDGALLPADGCSPAKHAHCRPSWACR